MSHSYQSDGTGFAAPRWVGRSRRLRAQLGTRTSQSWKAIREAAFRVLRPQALFVGFCFWDAGTLTFSIHEKDLAPGDLSRVHWSLESS